MSVDDRAAAWVALGGPALLVLAMLVRGSVSWPGLAAAIEDVSRIGVVLAVLAALAVFAWVRLWVRVRTASMTGRLIEVRTGPGHGTRTAAMHEGGHVAVTRATGGTVLGAAIYKDGSGVTWLIPSKKCTPAQRIAIDVAGAVAAGTTSGCGSDFWLKNQLLKTLPKEQRRPTENEGWKIARSVCRGFSDGGVRATAKVLLRDGQMGGW